MNKAETWPIYFTRGFLFHTHKHGERQKTCNYSICVKGESYINASDVNGMLIGRCIRRRNGGIIDVISSRKYYEILTIYGRTWSLRKFRKKPRFTVPIQNKSATDFWKSFVNEFVIKFHKKKAIHAGVGVTLTNNPECSGWTE